MKKNFIKKTLFLLLLTISISYSVVLAGGIYKAYNALGGYIYCYVEGYDMGTTASRGQAKTKYPSYKVRAYLEGVNALGQKIGQGAEAVNLNEAITQSIAVSGAYHYYSAHNVVGYPSVYYSTYGQ